jgi:hypothetical protein
MKLSVSFTRSLPLSTKRVWMWMGTLCILAGAFFLFWRGTMPLEGLVRHFAEIDALVQAPSMAADLHLLRRCYALSTGIALLAAGSIIIAIFVWTRFSEVLREAVQSLTMTLAVSASLVVYLVRMEREGFWLPISGVMRNPGSFPIFGHRLLFVWLAQAFERAAPHLSDLQAFILSQCVAIVLAVYALGKWSCLHIRKELSWLGQLIGAMLLSMCFSYYTFYDIGTVFFTTCGLTAIYTRRYWWLVPVVIVGTLNYEGLLLVILVAIFAAYGQDPPTRWIPAVLVSLVAYAADRFALQAAIPHGRSVDWRIWTNIVSPFMFRREMAFSLLALPWYAWVLMRLRDSEPRLKRLLLLFPLLFGVTFLFGQFFEPRQFDAFIPVAVAVVLSATERRLVGYSLTPPHSRALSIPYG